MIKVEDIQQIVKLVLMSGYLQKHSPLSLFIVGEVGTGKTEIISTFTSNHIKFISDLSKFGVFNILKNSPKITHFIIPDFIKITQKRRSTTDDLVSILNALTEEGLGNIDLYNFHHDFKDKKIGIISSTTKSSYAQNRKSWEKMGFVSRMLLCSYSYSDGTTDEIMDYIQKEKYLTKKIKDKITKKGGSIWVEGNDNLFKKLRVLSNSKFRTQKQLQVLCKCNALLRNDNKVKQEDIDEIMRLSKYLNLNYTKI